LNSILLLEVQVQAQHYSELLWKLLRFRPPGRILINTLILSHRCNEGHYLI